MKGLNLPDLAPAGRARGGSRFDRYPDIQTWPHTDFSPVTVGVYLEECGPEQGPLMAVRGSHRGPLHSMYDAQGRRVLRIPGHEIDTERVTALTGGAGSLVLLNCRTIHGSAPNRSDRSRPLLLIVYSSADSRPCTANPVPSPLSAPAASSQFAPVCPASTAVSSPLSLAAPTGLACGRATVRATDRSGGGLPRRRLGLGARIAALDGGSGARPFSRDRRLSQRGRLE